MVSQQRISNFNKKSVIEKCQDISQQHCRFQVTLPLKSGMSCLIHNMVPSKFIQETSSVEVLNSEYFLLNLILNTSESLCI